jgi:hypothetical protein
MLPSTMQAEVPENKPCSSETGDAKFEEIVHASKLIPLVLPLIGCLQMHSAFRKGVELLSGPESDPIQSHGTTGECPRNFLSDHMKVQYKDIDSICSCTFSRPM